MRSRNMIRAELVRLMQNQNKDMNGQPSIGFSSVFRVLERDRQRLRFPYMHKFAVRAV